MTSHYCFSQFEHERISFNNFYLGNYSNGFTSSISPPLLVPDKSREQPVTFVFDSINNNSITIINGSNQGRDGFMIVRQDSLGLINASLFHYIPSSEVIINNGIIHNDRFYLIGTINEYQLIVLCLNSEFEILWSKIVSKTDRKFSPRDLYIKNNKLLVISSERLGFYLTNSSGNPDVINGYTCFTEFGLENGLIQNHVRFNDGNVSGWASSRTIRATYNHNWLQTRLGHLKTIYKENYIYCIVKNQKALINQTIYAHKIYKLDTSYNVIWVDSLTHQFTSSYIYLNDFYLNNQMNIIAEFTNTTFAGNITKWNVEIDSLGNVVNPILQMDFAMASTSYNQNNFNHVPIAKRKFSNDNFIIEDYGSLHWSNNLQTGNALFIKNKKSGTQSRAFLNNNSSLGQYENQRFIGLRNFKTETILVSSPIYDSSSIKLQGLDILHFDSLSFNNWLCDDFSWPLTPLTLQLSFNQLIFPGNIFNSNQTVQVGNLKFKTNPLSSTSEIICSGGFDTCSKAYVKITNIPDTICQFESIFLTSSTKLVDSFEWYIDGVFNGGSRTSSFIFNAPGRKNIVLVGHIFGNICVLKDSVSIWVNPTPDLILNDTTICYGDTVQIKASGAQIYQWSFDSALSCLNCPDPFISGLDSTYFILTGTNSFGCSTTDTFFLNVYPKPNAAISGSNTVCPGITDVWFGLNPLDSFIATWWIDTVGIITQDFGDSIYTTWPQGIDSAFVYAYVQYPAGCEGDTIRFRVKVNQALEPAILVLDDSICFSDRENVTYNLSYNTNGSIYLWEIENGNILSGDSTASVQVSWDSVGTGKLIVREYSTTSIDTCFGQDSVFVEILPNPENDLMLTGKEDVCLEEDVEYTITAGWPNSSYDWIADSTSSLTGQGSTSITASWDSIGNYLLSAQEVSEYGCRGPKDSLNITVHPIPEPQRVGDDTLLCLDELGDQRYEVLGFINSTFNWAIESGIIKSGNGTESINVTWDSTIVKSLSVQEVSEYGCESNALQIKQYFDLSRLELFVVSVSEDSSITLDFELESLRSYPGDSIWIARRAENPDLENWLRVKRVEKNTRAFEDYDVNSNQASYGYRVEGKNTCEQDIISKDHASILLTGKRTDAPSSVSARELVELNWTAYRNWDGGVKTYELYEKFDSVYVKVAEANQTELTYDPRIPKKEHCFRIRAVQNGEEKESWSNGFCIELERRLNIPNVVTPNGDNKNDKLQIENLAAYPDHEITIYNRWGQEVFKTTAYQNNWPENATISGTYFYQLRITDKERNISEDYKGWVQVLR